MTLHAGEEMIEDDLLIFDIERCILTGTIIERQYDTDTAENKYRIRGEMLSGKKIEIIAKISLTGKLVIITVYKI